MNVSCPRCNAENHTDDTNRSISCAKCGHEFSLTHEFDTIDLPAAESRNSVRDRLLPYIERYKQAFHEQSIVPGFEAFLPTSELDRNATLVELIHVDLEQRWKHPPGKQVEEYLTTESQLLAFPRVVFSLLATEFRVRREQGLAVDQSEYLERFPFLEPEIASELTDASSRPRKPFPCTVQCGSCHYELAIMEGVEQDSLPCPSCGTSLGAEVDVTKTWSRERLPKVGKFQLLNLAGNGAFGAVYRAHDTELDRIVAVKIPRMSRSLAPTDIDQSLDEARNAARLTHPGIVPIYEVGATDDYRYIVSEFVEGVTLSSYLSGGQLPTRRAVTLVRDVAKALEHAHDKGVVHMDLKPANLMLDSRQRPRILDFGLGRRASVAVDPIMQGRVLGTPRYMSPEQAAGKWHAADHRADIFSLGVILFQLLTGELPFRGDSQMLLHQIKHEDPPSLRTLNHRIAKDLDTIVLKCMEKDPAKRYRSARELADELTRYLNGEPIVARPITPVERGYRWCKRRPVLVSWIGGLTSVIVLITAVAFTWITLSRNAERAAKLTAIELAEENEALFLAEQKANAEALQRLRQARRAVDESLLGISEGLQYYPGLSDVRIRWMQRAASDYQSFAGQESDNFELERERANVLLRLSELHRMLAQADLAAENLKEAQAILQRLASERSDDIECQIGLANYHLSQGLLHASTEQPAEAENDYREAIARLTPFADKEPVASVADTLAEAHINLGELLFQRNELPEAEAELTEAIKQSTRAVESDPTIDTLETKALAHLTAGRLAFRRDQLATAVEHYEEALGSFDSLKSKSNYEFPILQSLAGAQLELANVHRRLGDLTAEREAYEVAVESYARLNELLPGSAYHIEGLALARSDLGQWLHEQGRTQEAHSQLNEALAGLTSLLASNPTDVPYVQEVATCLDMLSQVAGDLGDHALAIEQTRQAIEHYDELVASFPRIAAFRERLAVCQSHLGQHLHAAGEDNPNESFEKAIAELKSLIADTPEIHAYRHLMAQILTHQGEYLFDTESPDAATAAYQQAIDHWRAITGKESTQEYRNAFAWFLATCPVESLRDSKEALRQAELAVAAAPRNPIYLETLAAAQYRRGDYASCLESVNAANRYREQPHLRSIVFETMALAALSNTTGADESLAKGAEWLATNSPGDPRHARWLNEAREATTMASPAP